MRYALIRQSDISNGEGVGVALFVQGCHFQCPGCFNQETWSFDGGKEFNEKEMNLLLHLAGQPWVTRVSILGGEPLAEENAGDVVEVMRAMKEKYPNKVIWLYSGYKFEDLFYNIGSKQREALYFADVLVDGRFELDKQDTLHRKIKWAGSTNQRVLDVVKSVNAGEAVLYNSIYT